MNAIAQERLVMTSRSLSSEERKILIASSLGTIFEWYDFFLYGSLAAIIARQFFAQTDAQTALIFALLAFAAGFIVRPFGAIVFGRLGDMIGRKYTFLVTISLMGVSTFAVGLLPTYASIGIAAPVALIILRLLQGLAMGGEYGGAIVYVAEHAPVDRRGYFTSWIQTTATGGLVLSLAVILGCRTLLGEAEFAAWGWRIPFLLSIVLLAISVVVRMAMHESPVFQKMKEEGRQSKQPLDEAFGRWANLRIVLLALFGVTAGLGIVGYTGQFYLLLFLMQTVKLDPLTTNILVVGGLVLAVPFTVLSGWLSDRYGRKLIILAGLTLCALTYFPAFKALMHYGNPALETALQQYPVIVVADPDDCSFQFNPTGTKQFKSSCDIAKSRLVAASVSYSNETAAPGSVASVRVGAALIESFDGTSQDAKAQSARFATELAQAIKEAGYPSSADPAQVNKPMLLLVIFVLVVLISMAYGPAAALLVEMFPARIRYTSLSLPYHIGTGWFGGLLPTTAFALVAFSGDIYFGLWYSVIVLAICVAVGALGLRETKDVDIAA
ncbi:MFS family permease [Variovorax boronicumulans]|uniref:MFS transporter n=1 Tax=Variovorax boronicumulans TaxID=436515 RepID=UPI00278AFA41|nr:MFS transporter [Variovorax boronicumulans]MDQ0073410.1 MFS family permease [Variovorax boronicumulans]